MSADCGVSIITQDFSTGVARENVANAKTGRDHLGFLATCETPEEYCASGKTAAPLEYGELIRDWRDLRFRVLDIGVGRGESSVFLANLGHNVIAVEPSLEFCNLVAA